MIREFAIEPEVMATWQHFREIFDDLGVCNGRLAAVYPSDWFERVRNLAQKMNQSVKATAIAERMRRSPHRFTRKDRAYDKGKDWLNNAEQHLAPGDFEAVIARKNPREKNRVLIAGEYSRSQKPWHLVRQTKVSREAETLAQCAALLLAVSSEVKLVDPHFDAAEVRFKASLAKFLGAKAGGKPWRKCELHTYRPDDSQALDNRKYHAKRHLAALVPTGTTLQVFFWSRKDTGEKLHPRFILTDLGGIQYDYGLDTGEGPGDKTIVTLMDETLWETVRADYTHPSSTFALTPDCIVDIHGEG